MNFQCTWRHLANTLLAHGKCVFYAHTGTLSGIQHTRTKSLHFHFIWLRPKLAHSELIMPILGWWPKLQDAKKIVGEMVYKILQIPFLTPTQSHAQVMRLTVQPADQSSRTQWSVATPKSLDAAHLVPPPLHQVLPELVFQNCLNSTKHILWNTPRGGKLLSFLRFFGIDM